MKLFSSSESSLRTDQSEKVSFHSTKQRQQQQQKNTNNEFIKKSLRNFIFEITIYNINFVIIIQRFNKLFIIISIPFQDCPVQIYLIQFWHVKIGQKWEQQLLFVQYWKHWSIFIIKE